MCYHMTWSISATVMIMWYLQGYTECYRIVCYYESWSQYPTNSKNVALWPEDIDPHMCTHINYAFAAVDNVTHRIRPIEWNDEGEWAIQTVVWTMSVFFWKMQHSGTNNYHFRARCSNSFLGQYVRRKDMENL